MTNEIILSVYSTLFVLSAVTVIMAMIMKRSQTVTKQCVVLSLMLMGWQMSEIIYYASTDPVVARVFCDVKLVFVAFAAPQMLITVLYFFNSKLDQRTKTLLFLLFILPIVTACLSLTSVYHPLIRSELVILQMTPLHIKHNVRGIWFWIHSAYSYCLTLLTAVIVIRNHRKLSAESRTPSALIVAGMVIVIVSNVLYISGIFPMPFDITLIGLTISIIFLYVAININEKAGFLILARDEIFSYMEQSVFILDSKQNIIDYNKSAKHLLEYVDVHRKVNHIDDVMRVLSGERWTPDWESKEFDIYVNSGKDPLALNIRTQEILNNTKTRVGMYVTLNDVTEYKSLINQLSKISNIDELTGLGNRRKYESDLVRLNTEANLPLSVIVGDVNGLKEVNDRLGHYMGDALLRTVGQVFLESCQGGAEAFRIGGDEFIVLLPNSEGKQAESVITTLNDTFGKIRRYPFVFSVSFGYATKMTANEPVEDVVVLADRMMYQNKEARKCDES